MSEQDFVTQFKSRYKRTSSFLSGFCLMLIDALIVLLSIGAGFFIINLINRQWINFKSFVTYWVYLPPIVAVFYAAGLYPGILLAPQEEVKRFSLATFFSFMGIAISISVENSDRWFISAALVLGWPFATFGLPLGREIFRRLFAHFRWWGVPVVIYSKGFRGKVIVDRLIKQNHFGYHPCLVITDMVNHPEEYKGLPVYTSTPELEEIIKKLKIRVAILCDYDKDVKFIQTAYRYIVRVPKNQIATAMSLHMRDFGGILGFSSTNYLTKPGALAMKRFGDIALCLLLAIPVLLVSLFIIIIMKISDPGPIFYGHKRVGKNHKEIKCWKFRSMRTDAEERLKEILATDPVRAAEWEKDRKFTDDPRVTKFGKFLRKTSLDELPQLWNIFVGEMSFVGPRPVTEPELAKYGDYADYILTAQPGLSGMWQTSGRSDTGYEERITLDTYYIQNWSVWLDIWIVIKTVWVVFKGKGAY